MRQEKVILLLNETFIQDNLIFGSAWIVKKSHFRRYKNKHYNFFFLVLCFSCIRYILIKLYEVLTLDGIINSVSENVLHHNSSYQKINDTPMQFLRNIKLFPLWVPNSLTSQYSDWYLSTQKKMSAFFMHKKNHTSTVF